ncbi:MAG: NAD(P)/FAD-dependent oxidoreductase [bacterium]|nr:NAD(P)/FAD-dependent oxidoreductase [bacterium]MDE0242229.1 NAD(P)/FAD-dependent oxidoreductase [bacterium]MDE0416283.1 NAD(P)/FAD-dependent oxidoreductase [bacterium]
MTTQPDVVVIGAGTAGLAAAKELVRLGVSCTVIEASHRIGGRAYSEEIMPDVWFDLGCAWLGTGVGNPFAEIGDELGIELGRFAADAYKPENHRFVRDGTALAPDEWAACRRYFDDCHDAIAAAAERNRDIAISDVIDLENTYAAPFLENVATAWGLDADEVSTADFASSAGELGYPAVRGYGSLVATWGADVEVTLNARAERIDWSRAGVSVETSKGTVTARRTLCTVSTGILGSGELSFSPQLPDWKQEAVHGLPMGTENKMGVAFDKDVFGAAGRGHYTVWNHHGETAKIDASAMGLNVAAVFAGGRQAIWLERQGPQACHDFAVDRVAEVFGNGIRKHVVRSITTAWSTDPWTRGSWACARPGQAHQREHLARAIDDRLFFAGEATMVGGQGTCHGAYFSGIRAATEIAAGLHRD